jgi:thiazole synthase
VNHSKTEDTLTLYGQSFASRLLLGTSRYESPVQLAAPIRAADPALLTVSVRRQLPGGRPGSQETGKPF